MNKKGWAVLLFLCVFFNAGSLSCVTISRGESREVEGILYQATKGANTVFLLGSIHIGNQEMYPYGATLTTAMQESDVFVFECDTTSKEAVNAMQKVRYIDDGHTLADVVPVDVFQKLKEVCEKKGYPLKSYEKQKPWMVMSTFSMLATAEAMGVDNLKKAENYGVEANVRTFAQKEKKTVRYLETTEEQLKVLESFSPTLQAYLLEDALDLMLHPEVAVGMDADMGFWPAWWSLGDEQAFIESFQKGVSAAKDISLTEEYYDALIYQRNLNMAQRIEAMLMEEDDEHTYFVTVGLLHLILPQDSVLHYLREMGYQIIDL